MRPLDGLRDIFIEALEEIPNDACVGAIYIGKKRKLIDEWNKEIDYLKKHYDFTYKDIKEKEEKIKNEHERLG